VIVLGIETSCDETAAAVVDDAHTIRANVVLSQTDDHRPFGGVVPEVAARAHLEKTDFVIAQAMRNAGLDFADLDCIAATAGPGLVGQGHRTGHRQTLRRRQSSGRPRVDGAPHR
jgi:N6-L-threonylcarbamoyladenine synthase